MTAHIKMIYYVGFLTFVNSQYLPICTACTINVQSSSSFQHYSAVGTDFISIIISDLWRYNSLFVYCRELAPGTVSLTTVINTRIVV